MKGTKKIKKPIIKKNKDKHKNKDKEEEIAIKKISTFELKDIFIDSCISKINSIDESIYSNKELRRYCNCMKNNISSRNINELIENKKIKKKIKKCMFTTKTNNKTRLTKLYTKKYKESLLSKPKSRPKSKSKSKSKPKSRPKSKSK